MFRKNNKKILRFNFITQHTENLGSMRSRIISVSNYLLEKGYRSVINGNIKEADIIIFQKGNIDFIKKKFIEARKFGKFIIFDIDDWFDKVYDAIIRKSDLVFVGSSFLKRQWERLNKNIIVLDDPLDIKNIDIGLAQYNLTNPKIGWFGNRENLAVLERTQIEGITKITRGGDIEWSIETIDENIQKFDLIVIPQDKSMYGCAKGNCRMLKALYLGVPVLVSDLEAYIDLANVLGYPQNFIMHDNENWSERIREIKSGKIEFGFDFKLARQKILKYYGKKERNQAWLDTVISFYTKERPFLFFKSLSEKLHLFRKEKKDNKRMFVLFNCIKFTYRKNEEK